MKLTPREVEQIEKALALPRQCYWIMVDQFDENGFIPSLVTEGEAGHQPLNGGLDGKPWYWGKTYADAKRICAKVNQDDFGLDESECLKIVLSSMNAGPVPLWKGGHPGS